MIIHLPDNTEFEINSAYNYVPSLNSRYILCYNRRKLKENCCMCKKCLRAKVVEKSEDGNDIWIEFDKNEEL